MRNIQVCLSHRPVGEATAECFSLHDVDVIEPSADDVLVRNIYLSCDPYMRGQLGDNNSYKSNFELDSVIPARVVGEVIESNNNNFNVGEFVWGFLGWELYTCVKGGDGLRKIDPELGPISHAVSILGMPGLTAYVGMLHIGNPQPGETVFVSSASGAVGQVAGQLARLIGARVVGSAGTDEKVHHITETLGFDAGFNYKTTPVRTALAELCDTGIDVYFDNVGGETLDEVLARLNARARVAVCGQISQYDNTDGGYLMRNMTCILGTRSLVQGFSVRDNMQHFDAVIPELARWLAAGDIRYKEDIVQGIEQTPAAFVGMMRGQNLGKRLVQVSDDQTISGVSV